MTCRKIFFGLCGDHSCFNVWLYKLASIFKPYTSHTYLVHESWVWCSGMHGYCYGPNVGCHSQLGLIGSSRFQVCLAIILASGLVAWG